MFGLVGPFPDVLFGLLLADGVLAIAWPPIEIFDNTGATDLGGPVRTYRRREAAGE
jgi:hypothetical protein